MSERLTVTCLYHCSPCKRHFHSLAAFDIHRVGKFQTDDQDEERRCASPLELLDDKGSPRLVPLTEDGECRVYAETETGVVVWTTADYERVGQRFG